MTSRFNTPRIVFGARPVVDAVPSPRIGRADVRRTAMLAEAADVLTVLPADGESLHAIMTGHYDLAHLLTALVGRVGKVEAVRVATLSYNRRNLTAMVDLLDSGAVAKITLLCSSFFRDHNRELWADTLHEFRDRGQRAAAARSHCKIVTLAVASGERYAMEGSANLRTNGNREQFALFRDAALHDWHALWIDQLVSQHEGDESRDRETG